jgi:cytochrome c556
MAHSCIHLLRSHKMLGKFKSGLIIAATFALLTSSVSWAGELDAKYRRTVMSALGSQFSAFVMVFTNKVDRPGELQMHADALAATSATVASLFPEGSEGGDALPLIWREPAKVDQASALLNEQLDALAAAVRSDNKADIAVAFKAAGKACKGCHERYKEEDD